MLLCSILKARAEAKRCEAETGIDPIDMLLDFAEDAEKDWTEVVDGEEYIDTESVLEEIENHADHFIEFMRENYPNGGERE